MPPRTPKPVVIWPIDGSDESSTRVIFDGGLVNLHMPRQARLSDYETTVLYLALTAARRARRTKTLPL